MDPIITKFIDHFNISIKSDSVRQHLKQHISQMIFNITSLSAIITLTNHKEIIGNSDINEVYKLLNKKLSKKMKGGEGMPSDFYGYSRAGTVYTEANEGIGATKVSQINWATGIARPSQGPDDKEIAKLQSGGGSAPTDVKFTKSSKKVKEMINKIISTNYIVKLPSSNMKYLLNIVDNYLIKLGIYMKDKTITEEKFKKLIKLKQFSIFN